MLDTKGNCNNGDLRVTVQIDNLISISQIIGGSKNTLYFPGSITIPSGGLQNFKLEITYGRSGYFAYPNPASGMLNIEIDEALNAQSRSMQSTIPAAQPFKIATSYDLRLYDGQGNLVQQTSTKGGTIQFNTSNLPNGTYYLHIYDGVNSTPEIQQIMVEH